MKSTAKKTSLTPKSTSSVLARLCKAHELYAATYPGESGARQPVHTVYGGAQLFKSDTPHKLGELAVRALQENAPNFIIFAKALGLKGSDTLPDTLEHIAALKILLDKKPQAVRQINEHAWFAYVIHSRVAEKLKREAVEDFRIDFEDGYGNRPDAEEDHHAEHCAEEVARGMKAGTLSPFIGIRIKPFTSELSERSIRTLDVFLTTLLERARRLPENFVVTLPKVTSTEQVAVLVDVLAAIEQKNALPEGALKIELMVETAQSLFGHKGELALPLLVDAAAGRCTGAHFGTYDYTAGCNITAAHQHMTHPACDFARHVMQVSLAGTGIFLSDGATNIMPVGPYKGSREAPLTSIQIQENRTVVHRAWRRHYDDVRHSLEHAYYQGWDLHPGQLPTRYAATFSFFLEGLDPATQRLKNFIEKAAQATLVGDVFDDAATGQGLLNYFLRGLNCGAITEDEALATGLTLQELRSRSFVKILEGRRK